MSSVAVNKISTTYWHTCRYTYHKVYLLWCPSVYPIIAKINSMQRRPWQGNTNNCHVGCFNAFSPLQMSVRRQSSGTAGMWPQTTTCCFCRVCKLLKKKIQILRKNGEEGRGAVTADRKHITILSIYFATLTADGIGDQTSQSVEMCLKMLSSVQGSSKCGRFMAKQNQTQTLVHCEMWTVTSHKINPHKYTCFYVSLVFSTLGGDSSLSLRNTQTRTHRLHAGINKNTSWIFGGKNAAVNLLSRLSSHESIQKYAVKPCQNGSTKDIFKPVYSIRYKVKWFITINHHLIYENVFP